VAEDDKDIREVGWHPRLTQTLLGHAKAEASMRRAFESGKLHHAWLISGPKGIGKASLAYHFARIVLSASNPRSPQWIASRSHPDLFVLECLWDSKTRKLKSELGVDNARLLSEFFGLTAGSGGWRVAIIDTADDLNNASANALLKLIEEPPPNCLLLLVCNQPGRLLRTIRSRCMRIDLQPLSQDETMNVVSNLPLDEPPSREALDIAVNLSGGSPGRALDLLESSGAKSFAAFQAMAKITPSNLVEFGNRFTAKSTSADDFEVFCDLLEGWVAAQAREKALQGRGHDMAEAFSAIGHSIRQTNALNLDRRQTVIRALSLIDDALKTA
jgi:DNA polymerase III subunit delta'